MALEVEPLTSADGRPITIVPNHGHGQAQTVDEATIELLVMMNDTLSKILALLELEFEFQTEEFINGEN